MNAEKGAKQRREKNMELKQERKKTNKNKYIVKCREKTTWTNFISVQQPSRFHSVLMFLLQSLSMRTMVSP